MKDRAGHSSDTPFPKGGYRVSVVLPAGRPRSRRLALTFAALIPLAIALALRGTGYEFAPAGEFESVGSAQIPSTSEELRKLGTNLNKTSKQLTLALEKAAPKGNYVVIDQTQNRIYLMNAGKVVHEAVCSAGSGMVLQDFQGKRKWVFDTPRGVFRVTNRKERPAWKKPDWAFVEEGKPIPAKDSPDRIETGTLGEYALYLEDGYMIHGTLYERLLGRNVSHGCVRVGRDDLRVFWQNTELGTPVYIF